MKQFNSAYAIIFEDSFSQKARGSVETSGEPLVQINSIVSLEINLQQRRYSNLKYQISRSS